MPALSCESHNCIYDWKLVSSAPYTGVWILNHASFRASFTRRRQSNLRQWQYNKKVVSPEVANPAFSSRSCQARQIFHITRVGYITESCLNIARENLVTYNALRAQSPWNDVAKANAGFRLLGYKWVFTKCLALFFDLIKSSKAAALCPTETIARNDCRSKQTTHL